MSLDSLDTVDAISDSKGDGTVSLSIIDGWDWSDEAKHLFALQAKINAYFDFVQSGQILETRPSARGKELKIQILTKYPLPEKATKFIAIASKAAQQLNIEITHSVLPSNE
jgi:hypothetical protein